jgi:hypothetical protein
VKDGPLGAAPIAGISGTTSPPAFEALLMHLMIRKIRLDITSTCKFLVLHHDLTAPPFLGVIVA